MIELAGPNPGEHDHLQVNGDATLAGRLVVVGIDDYEPDIGDRFTILSCASRIGEFTLETGSPGAGWLYETYYYADRVEIEIYGDPSHVLEPDVPNRIPTTLSLSSHPMDGGVAHLALVLPQTAQVMLEVFNLSGRRVAVLAKGPENAGSHGYTWNGTTPNGARANSGVYFARVRVGVGPSQATRTTRFAIVQ